MSLLNGSVSKAREVIDSESNVFYVGGRNPWQEEQIWRLCNQCWWYCL